MSHIAKLTEEYFNETKAYLRWHTNHRTAKRTGLSLKTVLQIRGSRNYIEYQQQNKAQHPFTKYSIADDVMELHKELFHSEEYKKPRNCQIALIHIRDRVL